MYTLEEIFMLAGFATFILYLAVTRAARHVTARKWFVSQLRGKGNS